MPDGAHRISKIIQRIVDLSDTTAADLLAQIMIDFSERHRDIKRVLGRHMNEVRDYGPREAVLSETKRALIGAYFTMEYSIESAALFNPSIVPHPDQSHLDKGSLRFIMSLRATGEGHISSIVFRSGVLDSQNTFLFDPASDYVETPDVHLDPLYDRYLFHLKLLEMTASNEVTAYLLNQLPDNFTYNELENKIEALRTTPVFPITFQNETFEVMYWLINSNYEVNFRPDHLISERVIFPVSKNESRGIEDARFDQQPVEAQAMVSACLEAARITGDKRWRKEARRAFEWFLGRNDLNLPIYDPTTGGCRDGLHLDRPNENQGAESTLAFLQSLLELRLAENTLLWRHDLNEQSTPRTFSPS